MKIDNLIRESKKFIIECNGLYYLWYNVDSIKITTDVSNFGYDFEDILETLFKKFRIDEFEIRFHYHKGDKHDKDIEFSIKETEKEKVSEIIMFILKEMYKLDKWNLKPE